MNQIKIYRRNEIFAGILFFIATLSYIIGSSLIENNSNLFLGSIFEIMNIISVFLIAFLLFPILNNYDKNISKIYLFSFA